MTPNILYSKSKFHKLMVPYPEKPKEPPAHWTRTREWENYENKLLPAFREAVAASLASAVEFDERDQPAVKRLCHQTTKKEGESFFVGDEEALKHWTPSDGQLFAVEGIGVEVVELKSKGTDEWNIYTGKWNHRQVVRLKAKPESDHNPFGTYNVPDDKNKSATYVTKDSAPPEPTCGQCGKKLTLVRAGKHQCYNPECAQNKAIEPDRGTEEEEANFKQESNPLWNIVAQSFVSYKPEAAIEWLQRQGIEPVRLHPAPLAKGEWRIEGGTFIISGPLDGVHRLIQVTVWDDCTGKGASEAELQAIAVQLNSGEGEQELRAEIERLDKEIDMLRDALELEPLIRTFPRKPLKP